MILINIKENLINLIIITLLYSKKLIQTIHLHLHQIQIQIINNKSYHQPINYNHPQIY
jgi:hypothetical protein